MKTTMETPVNNLLIEDGDRMIALSQGSFIIKKTGGKESTVKVPNGETIDLLRDWTITFPRTAVHRSRSRSRSCSRFILTATRSRSTFQAHVFIRRRSGFPGKAAKMKSGIFSISGLSN